MYLDLGMQMSSEYFIETRDISYNYMGFGHILGDCGSNNRYRKARSKASSLRFGLAFPSGDIAYGLPS